MSRAELPAPLAEGDLARTPFAHLLLTLRARSLTGTLVVWNPEGEEGRQQDRVRFQAGHPVAGRILERASRLDRGLLPLFARTDGPFAFYEDVDLVGQGEAVKTDCIDVLALVAASLRGPSRDDAVAHVLAGLGDAALRFTLGADLEPFALLPEEASCLELLRAEPMSVARLSTVSPLDDKRVRRLVYLGTISKFLEPWDGVTKAQSPTPERTPRKTGADREPAPPRRDSRPAKPKAAAGAPEPPPPAPERLAEKHRVLWEEVRQRAIAIERENYYDMLGVARDAPATKIETAYYGLVKKWHPDRIPAELLELRPTVELIFQYLTRAQETLCDDTKRGPYLQTVQAGGGTPEAERQLGQIVQAAMEFRKVELLMKRREHERALALVDEILAVSPDEADYHAARAEIVLALSGGDAASRLQASASVETALRLAENHERAHFIKGQLLKQAGKVGQALEHFRRAAQLNPRNIDAAREVRLAEMRGTAPPPKSEPKESGESDRDKPKDKSKESLFGKLFSGKKKD